MRYVKLLIALALVAAFWPTGKTQAQTTYPTCNRILKDNNGYLIIQPDSVVVQTISGKPGDTVDVSIIGTVAHDMSPFLLYLDVDTTYFLPLVDAIDTTGEPLYTVNPGSYLLKPDSFNFLAYPEVIYTDTVHATRHLRIKISVTQKDFLANPVKSASIGRGEFIKIPFYIKPTAKQDSLGEINWYYHDLIDSTRQPPLAFSCQYSQYSDLDGLHTYAFTTVKGHITVDSNATNPPIITFTANPTSISAGGSSTLSWSVTNADSVKLNGAAQSLVGSTSVNPSSTTTYTIEAWNSNGNNYSTQSVTVQVGSVVVGNPPVVQSIVPNAYTISQGGNVTFQVTATDADNDFLTLSALNMPANATFGVGGSVTGTGSASGQFSFTPNTTQEGTFAVSFQAVDSKGATSQLVTVTITVEGIKFDILYSKSKIGGPPSGGVPGKSSFLFPIDMVTAQTVYGVQFDMTYDYHYFTVDSIITTPRTQDWVVYDDIGGTPGRIRIVSLGMNNEELQTDTTNNTTILYVAMTIDSSAPWGTYPIYLDSGWESNNPDPMYPSLPLVTDSAAVQVDRYGDVNLDQLVNVADAVSIVATILGNVTLLDRQADVADLVLDGTIDVYDLVGVINMIYGIPVQPAPSQREITDQLATVSLDYGDMFSGTSDVMKVRTELPTDIAGVQLDFTYDPRTVSLGQPAPTAAADGLTMTYKNDGVGHMKVLMHFSNPRNTAQLIRSGAADLVDIPIIAQGDIEHGNKNQLSLDSIKLSTAESHWVQVEGYGPVLPSTFKLYQNYPNPFNPTTTIEFTLYGSSQHVSLDVFNVLGQRVVNLVDRDMTSGNYTVEWDATNSGGGKVATGIYFYRLTTGNQTDTKKMLLLK